MSEIKWFHCMDLGDGEITDGEADNLALIEKLHLPQNMKGLSVLDVGARDGFYSFECEKRGAAVVAIDIWDENQGVSKEGFNYAKQKLNSRVMDYTMSVYDLHQLNRFDLILFLGVLYHLEHPLFALENLYRVMKPDGTLLIETEVEFSIEPVPIIFYHNPGTLNQDSTTYFTPNPRALVGILERVGFTDIEIIDQQSILKRIVRFAIHRLKGEHSFFRNVKRNRMVVRARKPLQ